MVNHFAYTGSRRADAVFPPGWEAWHKPVTDASRTATVRLWSGTGSGWTTGPDGEPARDHGHLLTPDPVTARIQRLAAEAESSAGGQTITTRRYLVTLDRETPTVATTTLVEIVDVDDTQISGRFMLVEDAMGGSVRWERDLYCIDHEDPVLT